MFNSLLAYFDYNFNKAATNRNVSTQAVTLAQLYVIHVYAITHQKKNKYLFEVSYLKQH